MRARFKALLAAPVLALTLTVPTPASAAPYITICNSGNSVSWIKAYNNSVLKEYFIGYDTCVSVDNYGGNARVNVDPEYRGHDVYRWRKKNLPLGSGGYGPYYYNEDSSSNPYNSGTTSYDTDAEGYNG